MKHKTLEERLVSNKYNKFPNYHTQVFLSLLTKSYEDVLEVGCGKGYFTYLGAKNKKFKHCYASDVFNELKINEIAPFAEKVKYVQKKINTLPFKKNMFDLVFSVDVIEHIKNDVAFVKEQIRVCKSGGQIIIGTPNYWRIANIFLFLIGKLKYPRLMGNDTYGDVIHLREYKKRDLIDLLDKFDQVDKRTLQFVPCWFGLPSINIGVDTMPNIFENICNFWFLKFNKK